MQGNSYYERALDAGLSAVEIIEQNKKQLNLPAIEEKYIEKIMIALENVAEESSFIEQIIK